MAKYTIEVEGIYAISTLAPLVELIESRSPYSGELFAEYLREPLWRIFVELEMIGTDRGLAENAEEWLEVADLAEKFAARIRELVVQEEE